MIAAARAVCPDQIADEAGATPDIFITSTFLPYCAGRSLDASKRRSDVEPTSNRADN